jgi:hypothetical protein
VRVLPVALAVPAVVLLAAAPAPGAVKLSELPLRAIGSTAPLGDERLSNERTVTRWAYVRRGAALRRVPRAGAKRYGRLRTRTEAGFTELTVVLRSYVDKRGRTWVKVRVPGRPNGRRAWVPRDALGELRVVRESLRIDRRALVATLRRDGRVIWRSRVGIGKPGTPTPRGRFYVRERIRVANPGGLYGPWALGTSAYSVLSDWPGGGVIGIHGTNRPDLIPGRPSHGCIRVPNHRVRRLAALMPLGTPVRIS